MLLRRVERLRRRDHAEERAERVVVPGRRPDAADALDVDGAAEAHVAELGDGPAEACVNRVVANVTPTRMSYAADFGSMSRLRSVCDCAATNFVPISGRYGLARAV